MLSINKDIVIVLSNFKCLLLIFLILLARSCSTMLNRGGEGGHSCFVGDHSDFHTDLYDDRCRFFRFPLSG